MAVASNVDVGQGAGTGRDGNARPDEPSDGVGLGASAVQPESNRVNSTNQVNRFLLVIIISIASLVNSYPLYSTPSCMPRRSQVALMSSIISSGGKVVFGTRWPDQKTHSPSGSLSSSLFRASSPFTRVSGDETSS